MAHPHPRDPLAVLLHVLTLLVLTWIAFSLANQRLDPPLPSATPAQSDTLERVLRAVESALAHRAEDTATIPATAPRETAAPRAASVPPSPRRTTLPAPAPAPAPTGDDLLNLAANTPVKQAAATVRETVLRLKDDTAATRKSLYLISRTTALRRFGRPDRIALNQTGHECWHWLDGTGGSLNLTFGSHDYVVYIY